MKLIFKYLRNVIFLLLIITLFSSMLMAQKRPKSVSLDVDADDMKICASQGIFETTSKKKHISTTATTATTAKHH